jgi:hypothetical protein
VSPILSYSPHFQRTASGLTLPATLPPASLNAALAAAASSLRASSLTGAWRSELLPVASSFSSFRSSPLAIERGAAGCFAARGFGVHVNGYVRGEGGEVRLWVATRASGKGVCPGMLDHVAAGAINGECRDPLGTVVKECGEEAGIPPEIAGRAVAAGTVEYEGLDGWTREGTGRVVPEEQQGYKRDTLFCYDLELPADFIPRPVDGEVGSFELMGLGEVRAAFEEGAAREFKGNCYPVVEGFLRRQGAWE